MSLVTGLFFPALLLSSGDPHRSDFEHHTAVLSVLCDVPSISVFCSESIERFPDTIIIIIIIRIPYITAVSLVLERVLGLTDQALLTLGSAKNFVTKQHVLSITTFCVRMYRAWRRLSSLYYYYLVLILPIIYPSS